MTTQLREMFDDAADFDLPNGMATRAMDAARQRRRQRWVVGGSTLATAAVVLGVVVAVSDVRQDAQPRPTDVASIPDKLPGLAELPVLEAGSIKAASVAYIVEGQLVLVDSDGGDAFRYPTTLPALDGAADDEFVRAREVALSPDGTTAVITVNGYDSESPTADLDGVQSGNLAEKVVPVRERHLPSVRVIDVGSATESVISDLYPVGYSAGVVVASPATYAWVSDSSAFYCVCTADRNVTKLHLISVEADSPQVTVPEETSSVAPFQVAVGAAGVFAQESGPDPWWEVSSPASSGPLNGHALALSRSDETYLISQGSEFVIGEVGGEETFRAPLARQASVDTEYVVATDVDAAAGGFVATVAIAKFGDNWDAPADAITSLEAIFIRDDGAQQKLTSFPPGTSTASFASDPVAPQEPPTDESGESAELPAQLPEVSTLPVLQEGDIEAAQAAYLDGENGVAVIDAASGEAFAIGEDDASEMSFAWTERSQLALSPDGRYLLIATGLEVENRGGESIWLLDMATGNLTEQELVLAPSPGEGPNPTRMAWSPDSQTFACLCRTDDGSETVGLALIAVENLSSGQPDDVAALAGAPSQITWGTDGLAAQLTDLDPEWRLVPVGGSSRVNPGTWPPLESVSMLAPGVLRFSAVAMGHSDEGGFLGKLALSKGGGGELLVVPKAGEYRTVESAPSPPWLGALGDSYFVVLTDWKGDPYDDEVDRVDAEGETTLTTLPAGTTTITFASDLVG